MFFNLALQGDAAYSPRDVEIAGHRSSDHQCCAPWESRCQGFRDHLQPFPWDANSPPQRGTPIPTIRSTFDQGQSLSSTLEHPTPQLSLLESLSDTPA